MVEMWGYLLGSTYITIDAALLTQSMTGMCLRCHAVPQLDEPGLDILPWLHTADANQQSCRQPAAMHSQPPLT
jgi:hypothetical protein